jgi:hypothetical protein
MDAFGPRGRFLCGLRPPALERLEQHSVPRDFESPIGNLEFQTHIGVTSFV